MILICLLYCKCLQISGSNHMFGRTIWDKLPECIFERFEIARVKRGRFQIFQKSRERFISKIARTKHNTKPTNNFY